VLSKAPREGGDGEPEGDQGVLEATAHEARDEQKEGEDCGVGGMGRGAEGWRVCKQYSNNLNLAVKEPVQEGEEADAQDGVPDGATGDLHDFRSRVASALQRLCLKVAPPKPMRTGPCWEPLDDGDRCQHHGRHHRNPGLHDQPAPGGETGRGGRPGVAEDAHGVRTIRLERQLLEPGTS